MRSQEYERIRLAGAFRKALQTALTRLKPFGEEYKACLMVLESIDGLAGVLAGDREYFLEKLPSSSPSVERD